MEANIETRVPSTIRVSTYKPLVRTRVEMEANTEKSAPSTIEISTYKPLIHTIVEMETNNEKRRNLVNHTAFFTL